MQGSKRKEDSGWTGKKTVFRPIISHDDGGIEKGKRFEGGGKLGGRAMQMRGGEEEEGMLLGRRGGRQKGATLSRNVIV